MHPIRRELGRVWIAVLLGMFGAGVSRAEGHAVPPTGSAEGPQRTELRGRVVCLAEEMRDEHGVQIPTRHEHLYGFKTEEGEYYTLLRTHFSEAIFADPKVRAMALVIEGNLFPRSRLFAPTLIRAEFGGQLRQVLYFCDICTIYTAAPGICECCQGETRLLE